MTEVMHNVGRLMRPWVFMWSWVEEVDICVNKEEHSTVMLVMLYETSYWVKVARPSGVCPVCFCTFDGSELLKFVLGFVCDSCMVRIYKCVSVSCTDEEVPVPV